MDSSVWMQLPFDCLEHIASFCGIDERRALGFLPRKLPPLSLPPFRPRQEIWRYLASTGTLVYLNVFAFNGFEMEVTTHVQCIDADTNEWRYTKESTRHEVSITPSGERQLFLSAPLCNYGAPVFFAGFPTILP
jgi:hypothetical protein